MDTRLIAGIAVIVGALLLINAGISEQVDRQQSLSGETYVTITFDDAYRSQYRAATALEERGMRGVFYVPTGQLNGTFEGIPTMTGAQVRALQRRGHEIGGHTYNHSDMSAMTGEAVNRSLWRNRRALQQLGVQPISFAYPYGQGEDHAATVTDQYDYARTVRWETNRWPPQTPDRLATLALTAENHDELDSSLARMEPGDWLILAFHHIEQDGTVDRPQVDMQQETYEQALDRVQQANVTVVTFQQLEAGY
jgi:peptidoglycan/xylan/chitin deacetylase (PgdA/CDA1 family)